MTIKWEYDIEGTVEEIKELLGMMQPSKAGWSMTKIADEMRCSISTVSRYCQENAA